MEFPSTDFINYWAENGPKFWPRRTVRQSGVANATKQLTVVYEPYHSSESSRHGMVPISVPMFDPTGLDRRLRGAVQTVGSQLRSHGKRQSRGGSTLAPRMFSKRFTDSAKQVRLWSTRRLRHVHRLGQHRERVAVAAAQRLIPCSLELGGRDAMIVCADAESTGPSMARCGGDSPSPARLASRWNVSTWKNPSMTSSSGSWCPGRRSCG